MNPTMKKLTKELAKDLIVHNQDVPYDWWFDVEELDMYVDENNIDSDNWCDEVYIRIPKTGKEQFYRMLIEECVISNVDDLWVEEIAGDEFFVLWWD